MLGAGASSAVVVNSLSPVAGLPVVGPMGSSGGLPSWQQRPCSPCFRPAIPPGHRSSVVWRCARRRLSVSRQRARSFAAVLVATTAGVFCSPPSCPVRSCPPAWSCTGGAGHLVRTVAAATAAEAANVRCQGNNVDGRARGQRRNRLRRFLPPSRCP